MQSPGRERTRKLALKIRLDLKKQKDKIVEHSRTGFLLLKVGLDPENLWTWHAHLMLKLLCIFDFERSRNQRQGSEFFLGKWIL